MGANARGARDSVRRKSRMPKVRSGRPARPSCRRLTREVLQLRRVKFRGGALSYTAAHCQFGRVAYLTSYSTRVFGFNEEVLDTGTAIANSEFDFEV